MKHETINLEESYRVSEAIMKKGAVNFYHAFKHMDAPKFKAITAVYAFCRFVDDVVDENDNEPSDSKRSVLNHLKSLLHHETDSKLRLEFAMNNPWFPSFWNAIQEFEVPRQALFDQIDGQLMDLSFEPFKSQEELYKYCSLVAGSVGRMLLPMLADSPNQDLYKVCDDLGIAMQITNILRDIGEDLKNRNRIYLPQDLMDSYNINEGMLKDLITNMPDKLPQSVLVLWESLAHEAEVRYDAIIDAITLFDESARLPLLLAAENYRAILDAVRSEDYNCFTKRCYTSAVKRVEIFAKAKKLLKNKK